VKQRKLKTSHLIHKIAQHLPVIAAGIECTIKRQLLEIRPYMWLPRETKEMKNISSDPLKLPNICQSLQQELSAH
jgi:hypothetical protein